MWKKLLLVVGAVVLCVLGAGVYLADKIYLRPEHASVSQADFHKQHSLVEVQADLQAMLEMMWRIHPDFESVLDQQAINEFTASISRPEHTEFTRLQAYRLLATLNSNIVDGHTYLRRPAEEWLAYRDGGGRVLPLEITINAGQLIVRRDLSVGAAIPSDSRIMSINGVAAGTLADFALAIQSGENLPLRHAYAAQGFQAALWEFGLHGPFEVAHEAGGTVVETVLEGMVYREFIRLRNGAGEQPYHFEFLSGDIGYLAFDDMSGSISAFEEFLQQSFAAIAAQQPPALIIDLRNNGGGDSRLGDLLESYLSEYDLPAVERVEVHVTDEIKAYYQTLLPHGFRWIPLHRFVSILGQIADAPSGSSFDFFPEDVEPQLRGQQQEYRYDGPLYVLTGPRTFSSAVIFAAPLKHFKRAVFVGQETGEPLIFFGENYIFDLPATKLQAQVSHKKFYLVGATDMQTGIIPDVQVSEHDALTAALSAVRQN